MNIKTIDLPVARPTCKYCGKSCFVTRPCPERVKNCVYKQDLTQGQLLKLLAYVIDRGIISHRKMARIMGCYLEQLETK